MGIMNRFKRIIEGKANKALDGIENPMEQLDLSIRKREEAIRQAKSKSAAFIGSSASMQKELTELKNKFDNYKKVSIIKAKENDEEGFNKWHSLELSTAQEIKNKEMLLLKTQEQSDLIVKKLKDMENEINKLKSKRNELKARYATAKTLGSINETIAEINTDGMPSVKDIESKVIEKENYAEGINSFISEDEDAEITAILSKNVNSDKLESEMSKYKDM